MIISCLLLVPLLIFNIITIMISSSSSSTIIIYYYYEFMISPFASLPIALVARAEVDEVRHLRPFLEGFFLHSPVSEVSTILYYTILYYTIL